MWISTVHCYYSYHSKGSRPFRRPLLVFCTLLEHPKWLDACGGLGVILGGLWGSWELEFEDDLYTNQCSQL
jgi:hypothetical protein